MARVVFAISHSEQAGAQVIWADLAAAFRDRGHDALLLALYPGRLISPPLAGEPTWTHCLETPPRSAADALWAMGGAIRHLRAAQPDVVFTALPAANVIFPLAALLSKKSPRVLTSHHSPSFTYNPYFERLDRLVGSTHAVTKVICVSGAVRSSMSERSPAYRNKSIIIHNALPPAIETLTAILRAGRQGRRAGRTIVACGRLAKQKNYPVLIRAMAEVQDASLDIVGSGPDEVALKALASSLGLESRINFVGIRPREETLKLIATRDVFVQPSLFEGHSLALLEAARIALPIIVSNVPSQLEGVTRRDGLLCALTHDPQDFSALAQRITLLLNEDSLRRRLEALSESLGDEASFSNMVDRYESLINRS